MRETFAYNTVIRKHGQKTEEYCILNHCYYLILTFISSMEAHHAKLVEEISIFLKSTIT